MQQALVLFTKVPQPGRVKTRLAGYISPTDASNLYSAILKDIFDMMTHLAQSNGVILYVCYSPGSEEERIRELLSGGTETKTSFFPQKEEETTAQRIAAAFDIAFADGCDIAVLVFGDQPGLDQQLFLEAFQLLHTAVENRAQRLVLGPTCDGGTYLIGLTSGLTGWLHKSIDCTSTSKAVSRLVMLAQAAGIPFTILDERIDLDDPDDLLQLKNQLQAHYSHTNVALRSLRLNWSQELDNTVSVVIPTLNEEQSLATTILSIRDQPHCKEIIVVDGGSDDKTLEIANRLADRVVITTHAGRQHQENIGAMGAKGSLLLFLHADTVVPSTLLQSIIGSLEDPRVVAGGAHLRYSPPERFRYRTLCLLRDIAGRTLGISGMGSSFFIRRDIFRQLHGFDEGMNEEAVDICKRLRELGKHIMLKEVVQTSARRFESSGFIKTLLAWGLTVTLSYFGIRAVPIEKYVWRVVR